jgi:hypothetical protein
MQNGVQDMHWYNFQITILVHINYWINPTFDPTIIQISRILKEVHYYINVTRPMIHSLCNMCWAYTGTTWKQRGVIQNTMWYGQMGVQPSSSVHGHGILLFGIHNQPFVMRSWKGSKCVGITLHLDMGKGGRVDGIGAFLKCKIWKEQIKPQSQRLHNAHDVVMFC